MSQSDTRVQAELIAWKLHVFVSDASLVSQQTKHTHTPVLLVFFSVMHLLDQECSAANLFEEVHDNKLLEAVQLCYTETSSLVLDTLFKRYKLIEHFSAMRKYLLLGQGDLIR